MVGIVELMEDVEVIRFEPHDELHDLFDRSLDKMMVYEGSDCAISHEPIEIKHKLRRCDSESKLQYIGMNNKDTRSLDPEHDLFSKSQMAPCDDEPIQMPNSQHLLLAPQESKRTSS